MSGVEETRRILVAGIGNIFFGDDGFGVEVARRLEGAPLPEGVVVVDYGIRGVHLAFELLDPPELLVVVDAMGRGEAPGTLYLLEPDVDEEAPVADSHQMDLRTVFASVRSMGGCLPPVRIVGCEPAELGERMGLSLRVERAIEPAIKLVHKILSEWTRGAASTEEGARS